MIPSAVLVTEHWRHTIGKAHIGRGKEELCVKDDGNCRNAVLSHHLHHNFVEQVCGDTRGNVGNQFRCAVTHAVEQNLGVPCGCYEIENRAWTHKIKQRRKATNEETGDRSPAGTFDAHIHQNDEYIVKNDVADAAGNVENQSQFRFACGDKEHLKEYLYHRDGVKRHHDSAVVDAVGQQGFIRSQKNGKRLDEYKAKQGKNQTHGNGKECQ